MSSVNKSIIVGHLGQEPETRFMPNGDAVCNLTVATSESWKDKQTGEKREATEWHRVVVFRKLAEICSQYLKKGALVYIEGKLRTRKYQDKEGNDRYTTEIEATEMQMLGGRSESAPAPNPASSEKPERNAQGAPRNAFDGMEDDIPFAPLGMAGEWRVL